MNSERYLESGILCALFSAKMANWMNSVMSMGKAALEKMAAPADPNQVKVVNTTELAPIPTMDRYVSNALYFPLYITYNLQYYWT